MENDIKDTIQITYIHKHTNRQNSSIYRTWKKRKKKKKKEDK